MPDSPDSAPEPKASRQKVFLAADRILRSGRRPTVHAVRELLGGGSPNSVTAYINDWYRELGGRLTAQEASIDSVPPEAVSLLAALWRLARSDDHAQPDAKSDVGRRLLEMERVSLSAQISALETLNAELQRHRASAELSLADARALLARREAAFDEMQVQLAGLTKSLAAARMNLEVEKSRREMRPTRQPRTERQRFPARRIRLMKLKQAKARLPGGTRSKKRTARQPNKATRSEAPPTRRSPLETALLRPARWARRIARAFTPIDHAASGSFDVAVGPGGWRPVRAVSPPTRGRSGRSLASARARRF